MQLLDPARPHNLQRGEGGIQLLMRAKEMMDRTVGMRWE